MARGPVFTSLKPESQTIHVLCPDLQRGWEIETQTRPKWVRLGLG